MDLSIIQIQRDIILNAIRSSAPGEWKVLVVDEDSRQIIDNVVREDDILQEKVMNIEDIEKKRHANPETDVVYILSPLSNVVDCLLHDIDRRQYRRTFLLWTSILPSRLRERIDRSPAAKQSIQVYRVLNIEFHSRESKLVTLQDPYSFPVLFHPTCSNLVKNHISDIAQKIMSVCVALGENPTIRFYQPKDAPPTHESSVLCSYIAHAVQEELHTYARWNRDFDQPTGRPRGALYIVDRSMDLVSPFLHEFTYQAMAHDLLPIRDGPKVTYRTVINEGRPNQEIKDMEIGEKDPVWVEYRHLHMKDTIEKLMADFKKFIDKNPNFAGDSDTTNLNDIKDMLAGLPQFQEMKEAYTLHLSMAQDCMNEFQKHKLTELAGLEQTLATGQDEDHRKPKNLPDQVVRMLDEEAIIPSDRLRLIALYILYRDGILNADITKLLLHAQLPPQDVTILQNLELFGARVSKPLAKSSNTTPAAPLFPRSNPPTPNAEEISISRFVPALRSLLDAHVAGTLDPTYFPYANPADAPVQPDPGASASAASLRSAKPTWARGRLAAVEPRQRIVVFVAGGASWAEARAVYEVAAATSRDVVLVSSHMLTPRLWLQQLGDLAADRRALGLPADRPPKKAPRHLFEEERPLGGVGGRPQAGGAAAAAAAARPPVDRMAAMSFNGGERSGSAASGGRIQLGGGPPADDGKSRRDKHGDGKRKHGFFGSKK